MNADHAPLGRIGPPSLPKKENESNLKLQSDTKEDNLGSFFSGLNWTDRQILAMHFAEKLSPWEIHVILNLSMSDVLCRIQRLKRIARKSMELARASGKTHFSLRIS